MLCSSQVPPERHLRALRRAHRGGVRQAGAAKKESGSKKVTDCRITFPHDDFDFHRNYAVSQESGIKGKSAPFGSVTGVRTTQFVGSNSGERVFVRPRCEDPKAVVMIREGH